MEIKYYTVDRIEGDYAFLFENETKEEVFIAMALLPEGTDIGSLLRYEMFAYTLES